MIQIKADKPYRYPREGERSLFIYFPFSMERLAKVKSLPVRSYIPASRQWEVPEKYVDDVLKTFEGENVNLESVSADEERKAIDSAYQGDQPMPSDVFKTKPFEHQLEGFIHGINNDKFLLADEQGLGKTKQAIDVAMHRKQANGFKHTLIVCGVNSLKWNWMEEIGKHSDESAHVLGSRKTRAGKIRDGSLKDRLHDLQEGRDEFFLITNIESLRKPRQRKKVGRKFKNIELSDMQKTQLSIIKEIEKLTKDGTIGMVIFDEIHKAKNAESQQGKAIHHLKSPYKMALTGTPLMNKPIDLYNILKWLDEEGRSFYAFRNRYCVMGGFGGYEIIGYKNLKELQTRLDRVMLRRKKNEVLDLPPKIRSSEYVELKGKQRQIYNDVMRGVRENITEIKLSPNPLAQLTRLRQATAHANILNASINESAKFDRMKEIIEELTESGKKAIVFSNWTEVTDRAVKELEQYNPAVITGKTADRQSEIYRFQNDENCQVIVGTISAMGTGLTLTAASTVIFLDKPWNPANTEQAEDRAHRIGTEGTVNVISLIAKDTIDENIERILYEKGELAKGLVEGDDAILEKFDREELVDMLLSR